MLEEPLVGRRLRLTNDQRRRLAAKGKSLRRQIPGRVSSIVTPDTIRRWQRQLIAAKWTCSSRTPHRTGVMRGIRAHDGRPDPAGRRYEACSDTTARTPRAESLDAASLSGPSDPPHRVDIAEDLGRSADVVDRRPGSEQARAWARRDISEQARANIIARQESIWELLPAIDRTTVFDDEAPHATAPRNVAIAAIAVIFDAEGRSVRAESMEDVRNKTAYSPRDLAPSVPHHSFSSGGMKYYVPIGEFPCYDTLIDLMNHHASTGGGALPIAELPLNDVASLAQRALQIELQ